MWYKNGDNATSHFPYPFIHWQLLRLVPYFGYVSNAAVNIAVQMSLQNTDFFCFGYNSEVVLLGYVVALCLTFWGNVKLFFKELQHFTFLPAMYDSSNFPLPSSILAVICFFGSSYPSEWEVVSHCGFDL